MTKATQHRGLTVVMTLLAALAVLIVGCAGRSSQAQAKEGFQNAPPREPAQVKGPFQSPQMQSFNQELRAANTQAKATEVQYRLKELESTLQQTVDRLERLAQDFRRTQDDLERVRIERALDRQAAEQKSGRGVIRLEDEGPTAGNQPKASVQSGDPKQRLKDLLDQLQGVLERY